MSSVSETMRFSSETLLFEVSVEGESGCNASFPHDEEGYAVGQRVAFVWSLAQEIQAIPQQGFTDMDQKDGCAVQKGLAEFDRLLMAASDVEERHDFVDYV